MTRFEFYLDRSEDAYRTAKNICQLRRESASFNGDADVEMEYSLILEEWWYDYRNEHA